MKPHVRIVMATGTDEDGSEWEYVKLIWYKIGYDVTQFRREYK